MPNSRSRIGRGGNPPSMGSSVWRIWWKGRIGKFPIRPFHQIRQTELPIEGGLPPRPILEREFGIARFKVDQQDGAAGLVAQGLGQSFGNESVRGVVGEGNQADDAVRTRRERRRRTGKPRCEKDSLGIPR